ncbi:esterase-like activity of phytase family protein [Nocardioides sp. LHG3406-4]|uniref:esterase-like activity of phytase family protein n=1 Tax=Nocardioides sp. LHG3406-4 TaxID=2804575 RepID=UPI003CEA2138
MSARSLRGVAMLATAALPLSLLAVSGPTAGAVDAGAAGGFERLATYPVFQNVPAGVDPAEPTVAEISAVTEDGRTVVYTDALGKRVGFVDISDPGNPRGTGTIDLAEVGDADDQPTSVAVVGDHLLVVVDTSGGDFANPSGRLDVFRLADRTRVASIDLGGQPDSIAISKDRAYAAIAMENQRDEDAAPPGGDDGDLPQLPAGFVQLVDLAGTPGAWAAEPLLLTNPDGSALQSLVDAGLDTPVDPEPEYVAFNDDNQLALTLQENNGIAIIDVPTATITHVFSAGSPTITDVDTTDDGIFNPTDSVTGPREPDAIAWVDGTHVATANEGDWKGGSRGWTVFDATSGSVVWDAGSSFEDIATAHGLFNDDRADNKGAEPEGISVATIGGRRRAFIGSERSNFVAVYDLTDPADPRFEQVLPATNGPEGLLPVPGTDLFVVSSEEDDAGVGVRASVGIYRWQATQPAFPSVVSQEESSGRPIGWGALGALSAVPGVSGQLWAASDAAYKTGRIYRLDTTGAPAVIRQVIEVTGSSGAKPAVDIEGLFARPEGGFWAAVEGSTGAGNQLLRLSDAGRIQETVGLPAGVTAHIGKWGLEGVTATGAGASEVVYVAVQRPLWTNPANQGGGMVDGTDVTRIGRYQVATGTWTWFGYQLEPTAAPGDWMGLSEIAAVDDDTLAVIERDKLNGTAARVKRVYTVDVPATGGVTAPVMLTKKLAVDVLPALRATHGWTQEKLEGLTIGADRQVYAVTDNDGLSDATGETVLLRLGSASGLFGGPVTPPTQPTTPVPPATPPASQPAPPATPGTVAPDRATTTTLSVKRVRGHVYRLVVRVAPGTASGAVVVRDRRALLGVVRLHDGVARLKVRLDRGVHKLRASYLGGPGHDASRTGIKQIRRR